MTDEWYGQCWSMRSSSDAMWRIYSADKKCVRIKTTLGRLWDSTKDYSGTGRFILGKVQYLSQSQIQKDLEEGSPYKLNQLSDIIINSFFVKRNSFSHESEYRLIYKSDKTSKEQHGEVISLNIDTHNFIMNVYFDPRADKFYVERCKKVLVKSFGYPAERIHKSSLYEFKPCRIEVV